jgi:CheY-like chemotaxis protein
MHEALFGGRCLPGQAVHSKRLAPGPWPIPSPGKTSSRAGPLKLSVAAAPAVAARPRSCIPPPTGTADRRLQGAMDRDADLVQVRWKEPGAARRPFPVRRSWSSMMTQHSAPSWRRSCGATRAQVYTAGSVTEAMAVLEQTTPDLILTDVMMPDVDGLPRATDLFRGRSPGSASSLSVPGSPTRPGGGIPGRRRPIPGQFFLA